MKKNQKKSCTCKFKKFAIIGGIIVVAAGAFAFIKKVLKNREDDEFDEDFDDEFDDDDDESTNVEKDDTTTEDDSTDAK